MVMKNTHLEHPEDLLLLDGKEGIDAAINFLSYYYQSNITIKWDGSPAIVFGTCPETKKFFVGTKSVFNKKKIKINYSHYDISQNHEGPVAEILHVAYDNLPRISEVIQGDFIGFGGVDSYKPNVIKYVFPSPVDYNFIIACHTSYSGPSLKQSVASFKIPNLHSDKTLFLKGRASFKTDSKKIKYLISLARIFSSLVKYPETSKGKEIKKVINSYIRNNQEIIPSVVSKETGEDINLFRLYTLMIKIKHLIIDQVKTDNTVSCYIEDSSSDHEGYVMSNLFGTFKLVKRDVFSYANFTAQKNWQNK